MSVEGQDLNVSYIRHTFSTILSQMHLKPINGASVLNTHTHKNQTGNLMKCTWKKRLRSHLAEKCLPPMKGKRIQDVSSAPCGEACASSKCLHFRSVNKNMLLPHATIFSLCFYGASVRSVEIEPQDENQTSVEPIGQKMWSFIDTARVVFL